MFTRRIVCISGFLQPRYGQSGMARLWRQLRSWLGSASCEVTLHPWDDDWERMARLIVDTADDPEQLQLDVVAYSWGVGWGARTLAEALLGEGVTIRNLVACDGVYRSRWFPTWLQWRALCSPLLGQPTIWMPSNVRTVRMFRQGESLPKGHEIRTRKLGGRVYDHGLLPYPHVDIDGSREFGHLVRTVLGAEPGEQSLRMDGVVRDG